MRRPYTVLSCAMSLDGYLDDASPERLVLSNAADLDRVDAVRAGSDAVLVGAATVRRDDPRLLVRSADRIAARRGEGRPEQPTKVTVTAGGDLDPAARFFTHGDPEKLVYCSTVAAPGARTRLGGLAIVRDAGEPVSMERVGADLHEHGVRSLLVEGGGRVLTQFLAEDLADELHLVVAPFFVGDPRARRFVQEGAFPWSPERPARLIESRGIGDVVLLRYALSGRCRD